MSFGNRRIQSLLAGLFLILLAACIHAETPPPVASPTSSPITSAGTTPTLTVAPTATVKTKRKATLSAKTSPTSLANATTTFTPLPYNWQDAPIDPVISQHVIQLYREGQAQGRDPHSFSVIGDCQAVPVVFMGPYELGSLKPPSDEGYLWDVIGNFKGSFSRWGMAVRGGFTAASILAPLQADPQYCKSGETPLTCEYRVHNPAFVIITLETWLDPKTVDRYDGYLRSIMDYVISHGSVPILMTKADSSEMRNGTHVFNPIIVQVAHDYDVPVINFWRAAQYLDNGGIDRNREGFHLSQAGLDLKNTLTLRTLYNVWQMVTKNGAGPSTSVTPTPTPPSAPVPAAGPVIKTPDCTGGCVYSGRAGSQDGVVKFLGVYAFNYASRQETQVLGEGFNLQDVSQDGKRLLVNNGSSLYEIDLVGGSSKLITDSLYSLGKQSAYWNSDDSQVIYLDEKSPFQTNKGIAVNLFPSPLDQRLYFDAGSCTSQDFCQSAGVYQQAPGQSPASLNRVLRPVFSPDGKSMAFLNPAAATNANWYHINYVLVQDPQKGIGSQRVFYLPDKHKWLQYPDVRQMAFSPDGMKLFILDDVYYEYTENSLRLESYLVDLKTGILYNFGKLTGAFGSFKPQVVWSPQGDKLLFFLTTLNTNNQYTLSVYQTDLATGDKMVLYDKNLLISADYFYLTNIYWR